MTEVEWTPKALDLLEGHDIRDLPDRAFHPTTPEILDGMFQEASERIPDDS